MLRVVSVAVPVPGLRCLNYAVPDSFPIPGIGARVLVPLGARILTGCVVEREFESRPEESGTLKPLIDLLDESPFLPLDVVRLAVWVGDYYACGVGEAVSAAMPPKALVASERRARLTAAGKEALTSRRRGVNSLLLAALADGSARSISQLGRTVPTSSRGGLHAALSRLSRDGLVDVAQSLKGSVSGFKSGKIVRLKPQGRKLLQGATQLGLRQREALKLLNQAPDGILLADLERRGISRDTVRRLEARGTVALARTVLEREPWPSELMGSGDGPTEVTLTSEQQRACDTLADACGTGVFSVTLLHGVTGSGKTEVYRRLAKEAIERDRQGLILVPEVALTPAVSTLFRKTFGDRVAVQHSGLSEGARHDQWQRIRRGKIDVVVGTRSAVFAPLPAVGLIVVDEEHDQSYKQEESPRYHGRDVAVMRGKQAGALVVLGSATPSLESYRHAESGRYRRLRLTTRVHRRSLPSVRLVNMREEFASHGPDVVLSEALSIGLAERLSRQEQSLVLLNRRGFAASVFCRECSKSLECPNCSVSLTFHRGGDLARCHYCGFSRPRPSKCFECAGRYLEQVGFGTERVEADILERWPNARVGRLDRDSVQRRGAAARLLGRFARGDIDVLVGTQMVAKGHDFPRVTLVGVVSADVGLGVADFRAAERTFQLLTQVAGRAGRGEVPGEVIVQTLYPDHYSISLACQQAYEPFFQEEMRFRQSMQYPPAVALVNVVVRGTDPNATTRGAALLVKQVRKQQGQFEILGPAPAPIARLRGQFRMQLFLKGPSRREMREAIEGVLAQYPELKRRAVVDVDPVSML